jgi:hypothetical protein
MIAMSELTTFFGWCTVINLAVYMFTALFIIVFKGFTVAVHSKILAVEAAELPMLYLQFLAHYKIAILLFNLTPYLALKLMA